MSALDTPVRAPCSAGSSPNSRQAISDSNALNASTVVSGERPTPADGATRDINRAGAQNAIPTPRVPAMSASTRLSVSSCRAMRPRLAPSDSRTAISRRRAAALASSRLPTLAHASDSTSITAASTGVNIERALVLPSAANSVPATRTPPVWSVAPR